MEQDLFSWLNSQKKLQETGLLVAPLSQETPGNLSALDDDTPSQFSDPQNQTDDEDSDSLSQNETFSNEPYDSEPNQQDLNAESECKPAIDKIGLQLSEPSQQESPAYSQNESAIDFQSHKNESGHEDLSVYRQPDNQESSQHDSSAYIERDSDGKFQLAHQELSQQEAPVYSQNESAIDFESQQNEAEYDEQPGYIQQASYDDEEIPQDHEWQERATGFTLSLDEPPPELWTHINDDDPDPEYEPTDSLQGAAYVQIHGRNFTERLHHTLKHRKERAEERAQAENDNPPSKSIMQLAVILCVTLVMMMGVACLALWFVWRETPDGMKRRAESFIEAGKFGDAEEVYRKAHRRYPDKAEFLAGLSEASEKAGHHQTAKAAREEYTNKTESKNIPAKTETKPEIIPQQKARHVIPAEKPKTFTDYLNEANYAYNIGMYNRAVTNFFRAMNINSRDIRPYIGLSSCYRMKGMYFDSYRIIEEARRIFGRSPAVDMCIYFLREAK